MQPSNLQLLAAIRRGLAQLKADGTGSASLITHLDVAVGELLARNGNRAESLSQSHANAVKLAQRAAELAHQIGMGGRISALGFQPTHRNHELAAIEREYATVRQFLAEAVLSLNAALSEGKGNDIWRSAVRRLYSDLAMLEAMRAVDDFMPATPSAWHRTESFDFNRLKEYFACRAGAIGALQLIEVRSLSGGFSRETLMATLRKDNGQDITLILRKQLEGGLLGSSCLSLAGEIPYLALAHAAGLPVAEVLWHETDASILGGEFIVMSCMPGSALGTAIAAFGAVDETLLRDMAEMLARLHRVEWQGEAAAVCATSGVPVATQVSSEQAALAMCRAFETMWREANLDAMPTLELILDWLKRNPPASARPAMISHGDIGFHNMMGKDGHLTALLDWETARLADPAKDVSMVRYFVSNYVPWERFMGWYRDAGGADIDEAALDYYSIFNAFAHLLVCEVAMGARFSQAENPDLEYLQLGLPVRAFFAREMLRDCAPIWETDVKPAAEAMASAKTLNRCEG